MFEAIPRKLENYPKYDIINLREATSYPIKKALGLDQEKKRYDMILHEDQKRR